MKSNHWGLCLIVIGLYWQPIGLASELSVGKEKYNSEYYDEALPLLKSHHEQHPNPESQRYLGLTYYQLQDYAAAKPLLLGVAANPEDTEVQLALVTVLFGLGEFAQAQARIETLLATANTAEAHRLAGQIYLAQNDSDRALVEFETALQTEDSHLRQQIMMDILAVYVEQGLVDEASRAVQEAIQANPDTFEAEALQNLLSQVKQVRSPYTLKIGYRLETDSNVTLAPEGTAFSISEKSDLRQALLADATGLYSLGNNKHLFAEAHLYHSQHRDLDAYDELRQNYIAGFGYSQPRWGMRLPYEVSWNLLDGKRLLVSQAMVPGAYYQITPSHLLYGFGRYQHNRFEEDLTSLSEERSGSRRSAGGMWLWQFHQQGQARVLVDWGHDDTDGRNWARDEARIYGAVEYQVTPALKLGLGYQRDDHDYDNVHDVFLIAREDRAGLLFGHAAYSIGKNWVIQAQASRVNWNSNIDTYRYDRNVFSLGVAWHY